MIVILCCILNYLVCFCSSGSFGNRSLVDRSPPGTRCMCSCLDQAGSLEDRELSICFPSGRRSVCHHNLSLHPHLFSNFKFLSILTLGSTCGRRIWSSHRHLNFCLLPHWQTHWTLLTHRGWKNLSKLPLLNHLHHPECHPLHLPEIHCFLYLKNQLEHWWLHLLMKPIATLWGRSHLHFLGISVVARNRKEEMKRVDCSFQGSCSLHSLHG